MWGVPVPVSKDSTISLPLIGQVEVKDLGTRRIGELIRLQYLERGFLKEDDQNKIDVSEACCVVVSHPASIQLAAKFA